MIIDGGEKCNKLIADILNSIIREKKLPKIGKRAIFSSFIKEKVMLCVEGAEISGFLNML